MNKSDNRRYQRFERRFRLFGDWPSPRFRSAEQPITLFIDDLPALGEREFGGLISGGKPVGADEVLLAQNAIAFLLDHAGRLILALGLKGLRTDEKALMLQGFQCLWRSRLAGGTAREERFQKRHGQFLSIQAPPPLILMRPDKSCASKAADVGNPNVAPRRLVVEEAPELARP
ncbi:hypothetical protein CHELA20_52262 [Hyphomicrobiales bacterium]|nr:hypothetical protein CHELA20_52262 [Hyphomicrobiales bacterium]